MRTKTVGLWAIWVGCFALVVSLGLGRQVCWGEEMALGGVVVDESGNPVAGATVTVLEIPEDAAGWTFEVAETLTTDSAGRFAVTMDEETDENRLMVTASSPNHGLAFTSPGHAKRLGGDSRDLKLTLPKRASVAGKATDGSGNPVQGAQVTALITLPDVTYETGMPMLPPCEDVLQATTGGDGGYVLDGLPEKAAVCLVVKHPDYAVTIEGEPTHSGNTMKAGIAVGAADVNLVLKAAGTVAGTVTAEGTGEPVAGAEVTGTPKTEGYGRILYGVVKAETDAAGRYRLTGLAPIDYTIRVSAPDFVDGSLAVEVTEAAQLDEQNVALSTGVLLVGAFVDPEGKAPEKAGLSLENLEAEGPTRRVGVKVEEDGSFSKRLAPGKYRLNAYSQTGTIASEQARREITLEAGKDVTDIVIEVKPPVAFKGTVVDEAGSPVSGVQVVNRRHGGGMAETAADGTFELPLPGQRFGEHEWLILKADLPDDSSLRGAFHTQMQTEEDAQGTISMKPVTKVTGRVVDETGEPLGSATVHAYFQFERLGTTDTTQTTDEDGRFEFTNIITGQQYYFNANAEGYGKNSSERFTLESGEERDLDELELRLADQFVEGVLLDEDGKPVAGAHVYAYGQATQHASMQTDKEGKFRLENLVDEEITINANHGGQYAHMSVAAGETDVEVVLGQRQTSQSAEERQAAVLVGKEAPDLDVAAWVGTSITELDSLSGQAVALVFWDSAAEDAAEVVAALEKLAKRRRKLAVVGVHKAGADAKALGEWMKEHDASFATAIDKAGSGHGATAKTYKAKKLPAVYVIDQDGAVQYQDLPLTAVERAVKNLASGK